MPNYNKLTNLLTKIPDYVWIVFVMLFQYLNCVFNIQSQHGIWEMLQHLFTKHRENGLKLNDFVILPSSSSEACIAEYVRILSYKYEYVYTQWKVF